MGKKRMGQVDSDNDAKRHKHGHSLYSKPHHSTPDTKTMQNKDRIPDQRKKSKSEVQCWKCKGMGHKANDRECPMYATNRAVMQRFRWDHEDPMKNYIENKKAREKEERLAQLKALLYLSSSTSSSSEYSSDSDESDEREEKHKKKKQKFEHKKKRKKKMKTKTKSKELKSHKDPSSETSHRKKHKRKHLHHKHKKK